MKSLSESADLAGKEKLRKQSSASCGIIRSLSVKNTIDFSDNRSAKPEQLVRPSPRKTEDTYFTSSSIKSSSSTQGKAKLVKERIQTNISQRQSKDCSLYATLPRASSVISTAEGTTRRTSIHDFLSKDSRQPISIDPAPPTADRSTPSASSEYCVHQQSSNIFHYTAHIVNFVPQNDLSDTVKPDHSGYKSDKSRTSRMGRSNFLDKTFSFSSLSSDKIGVPDNDSTGSFTVAHLSQPFLSINTELVSNISGLPQRSVSKTADQTISALVKSIQKDQKQSSDNQKSDNSNLPSSLSSDFTTAACVNTSENESPLLVSEDNQTVWYEYGCV